MKKVSELKYWMVLIASIVLGVMCNLMFGMNFWVVALAVHFIWVAEKTTRWLHVIAAILILSAAFHSFLPQTASKSSWVTTAMDYYTAKQVDSTQIKASIILEKEKNLQKNKALAEYTRLVKEGKIEEAQSILDSIDQKYSLGGHEVSDVSTETSIHTLHNGEQVFRLQNIGDETPWLKFPPCSKFTYCIKSQNYGYEIIFDGEKPILGSPNGVIPFKQDPVFKIRATKKNQLVSITVIQR